jgi:dimethylamine monooxygenase subunit A
MNQNMGFGFETLPRPARYFPLEKGKYEVAPGLRVLGTPFGNGDADSRVFQIDREFPEFRKSKIACRNENLAKYFLTDGLEDDVVRAIGDFIPKQLAREHPTLFTVTESGPNLTLHSHLTHETLTFDGGRRLISCEGERLEVPYESTLDALACQIQEDIAVTQLRPERQDWLAALHICSASHWAAGEKIGKNFINVHAPVSGIEKVNAASKGLVEASIHKGPYTRFVWSMATDRRLNHHPEPPPGVSLEEWKGRSFRPEMKDNPFILRVERQITYPFPEVKASLFTIRISFIEGEEIRRNPTERELMRSAVHSMNEGHLKYKGLFSWKDDLLRWLDS